MNRSEQENLYRTSRKLSLVPIGNPTPDSRRQSGNREEALYHSEGAYRRHSFIREDFTPFLTSDDRSDSPPPPAYPQDLVLSVLKSPVNHTAYEIRESNCGCSSSEDYCSPTNNDQDYDRCKQICSEDEECSEKLPFLHRLRAQKTPRTPLFNEAHHRRVPTPIKRSRRKEKKEKILAAQEANEDIDEVDDIVDPALEAPRGVPDPYYPIYLPIDQAFKAKYVFHHKRGKTCQERTYVFLEHPGGWLCFIYHFSVGRLVFKQYIPLKTHKYGMKSFKVFGGGGYTWNMKIYCGKEQDAGGSVPTNVVMTLAEPLLDKGRTAATDNYYIS
ncbi:hypothetical protein JTB14_013973 [Gonioctena quinquepunctata]|nr:hypothetical protein JTB14_013973 [Gonioctena quinquepunctata]